MAGNQDIFKRAMEQGHSAAWERNWELAAENYRQAVKEFPDNASALTSLGLALFELQKFDGALECYQKATHLTPDDPIPFEKMAQILEQQGKVAEAIQALSRTAELYLKNKDTDKAINSWTRAVRLNPENMMARTRLAIIYERTGRKADAVAEYLATASILQKSGNTEKAIQAVEYCLQIQPNSKEASLALSLLRKNQPLPKPHRPRGETGILPAFAEQEDRAKLPDSTTAPDPIEEARKKALVKLAELLFDQTEEIPAEREKKPGTRGLANLARGVTGSLSLDKPDRAKINLHIGQAIDSQTQGKSEQAIEELERVLGSGFEHPAINFNLAVLLEQQQPNKAIRHLQKAVVSPDFSLAAYLLIGKIHLQSKNWEEATTTLLRALSVADATIVPPEQSEELLQVYEAIIEMQLRQNDKKQSIELCTNIASYLLRPNWREYIKVVRQQLPEQAPGSPPSAIAEIMLEAGSQQLIQTMARIRDLVLHNKLDSALEEAFYALQFAPTYLPLHSQIGEILLQEGQTQSAINKFFLISTLYKLRGEVTQALRTLARVVQLAPMNLSARSRLIDMLYEQNKTREAIQQTMSLANIHYQLAEIDQAREAYASALQMAQQSNIDNATTIQILYKLVDIDLQRLDLKQAVRLFEQIRTLDANDLNARARLVDLHFRLGKDSAALAETDHTIASLQDKGDIAKAIEFINGIITEHPEKLELRKRLADLYVRNGRRHEAVQHLDAIADALLTAGNTAGAISMLKAIVALNPPNIQEYQMAISQLQAGKQK